MIKKKFFPLVVAFSILPLASCSLIYGEPYQITSTGESSYVPAIDGLSKSYNQLKEDIPDLPMVVPGDTLRLKFNNNGVAESYHLEKTKVIKAHIARPIGNMEASFNLYVSPEDVSLYYCSKQFTGFIDEEMQVYDFDGYESFIRGRDVRIPLYCTYRKAIESDQITREYALLSIWSEAAWKAIGRL